MAIFRAYFSFTGTFFQKGLNNFLRCQNRLIFVIISIIFFRAGMSAITLFSKTPIHRSQNGRHRNGGQNHDTSRRAAGRCHGHCDGCSAAAETIEGSNESPRSPPSIRTTRSVSGGH